MNVTSDKQLFTELNIEEAAVIEGGVKFTLHSIYALKTGTDPIGADDIYIKFNGTEIDRRSRRYQGLVLLKLRKVSISAAADHLSNFLMTILGLTLMTILVVCGSQQYQYPRNSRRS